MSITPARAACPLTDAERAEMESLPWFHRIRLDDGTVTPGSDVEAEQKLAFVDFPESFTGKSVLDVGAWDGLFSFEAERRGARRVLATDSYAWTEGWGSKRSFEFCRRVLGSKVEDMTIDVLELSPERVGTFDVVLFLGILYHMRHPLLALERAASVCDELMIVSTSIDMVSHERPAAAFYPGSTLNGDPTNWWGPNVPCVIAMLNDVGFVDVDVKQVEISGSTSAVVHHHASFHARRRWFDVNDVQAPNRVTA